MRRLRESLAWGRQARAGEVKQLIQFRSEEPLPRDAIDDLAYS